MIDSGEFLLFYIGVSFVFIIAPLKIKPPCRYLAWSLGVIWWISSRNLLSSCCICWFSPAEYPKGIWNAPIPSLVSAVPVPKAVDSTAVESPSIAAKFRLFLDIFADF